MRALRSSIAVVTALAILAGPIAPGAFAERDELELARQHFAAGEALFAKERYAEAMAEFAQADAIIPSPVNSYNIALCHDRLGDVSAAVREYRAYLDALPEAPNRSEVEARIAALRAILTGAGDSAVEAPEPGDAEDAYHQAEPAEREHERYPEREHELTEQRPPQGWGAPRPGEPQRGVRGDAPAPAAQRADKPVYRSWWFWVVAGAGVYILYNIASAGSSDTGAAAIELPPPSGGMTLWRF
jgi:tetratricopeptide (TPR) repeat protein